MATTLLSTDAQAIVDAINNLNTTMVAINNNLTGLVQQTAGINSGLNLTIPAPTAGPTDKVVPIAKILADMTAIYEYWNLADITYAEKLTKRTIHDSELNLAARGLGVVTTTKHEAYRDISGAIAGVELNILTTPDPV
jgi:hypothetical protein